ncbi:MAG: EAL domain-containing protein [Gammaproteobacteria bacterium]|nr:EAL domain-containing protein [Gammaproteobacteria bacterium]
MDQAAHSRLTPTLYATTATALLVSGLLLASSFYMKAEVARAFSLGAFCLAITVSILLFAIARTTQALHASRERFEYALAISNDGLWDWDLATDAMYFSPRWRETLGYSAEQVGHDAAFWRSLIHPDDRARVLEELEEHLAGKTPIHQCENRLRTCSGEYRWNLSRARVITRDAEGKPIRILGVDVDMTALHELTVQLSHQESHDGLTGLLNRREFERRLRELLDPAPGRFGEHALCQIDLDQFKIINETCGSAAGDELLCQLGRLLRKRIRHRDTLARIGGDEFGILMEDCSAERAEQVARGVLETLDECRFNWRGKSYALSASIGLVPLRAGEDDIAEALAAADAACHSAKEKGRHRVHVFSPDDTELARRQGHMQWVSRISRALDKNRFRLSFQPIAPVQDGADAGLHYELLIRMQDENGNIVAPSAFLPAAEAYSLAGKIDRWVVQTALEWLARNPSHVDELDLCAINLSGHSLGDEDFLGFVVGQLSARSTPAHKICFEITETSAIANVEQARRLMHTLKDMGTRFALDDFGTGLSSFAYLKRLPVDFIKIDGLFIKDMADDPIHLAMVRSINDIGHIMGMRTIAEFVENEATLALLRDIGVDYAQGYGICPPRPIAVFERRAAEGAERQSLLPVDAA